MGRAVCGMEVTAQYQMKVNFLAQCNRKDPTRVSVFVGCASSTPGGALGSEMQADVQRKAMAMAGSRDGSRVQ